MALDRDLYDSVTVSVMEEEKEDDEAAADATKIGVILFVK